MTGTGIIMFLLFLYSIEIEMRLNFLLQFPVDIQKCK